MRYPTHFNVEPGEFVSVVGPSGCGKTTLLSALDGLLFPTDGSITIDGAEIAGPGADRAVVFQEASLLPWRTVLRNVKYGMELQKWRAPEADLCARKMLKMVGLEGYAQRYPHQLSGSENSG